MWAWNLSVKCLFVSNDNCDYIRRWFKDNWSLVVVLTSIWTVDLSSQAVKVNCKSVNFFWKMSRILRVRNFLEKVSSELTRMSFNIQRTECEIFIISFPDLSCSHNRCPYYFTESIRSNVGFYGRNCRNLFSIIIGLCRGTRDIHQEFLAGEDCDISTRGLYTIKTNSKAPFSKGHIIVPI